MFEVVLQTSKTLVEEGRRWSITIGRSAVPRSSATGYGGLDSSGSLDGFGGGKGSPKGSRKFKPVCVG